MVLVADAPRDLAEGVREIKDNLFERPFLDRVREHAGMQRRFRRLPSVQEGVPVRFIPGDPDREGAAVVGEGSVEEVSHQFPWRLPELPHDEPIIHSKTLFGAPLERAENFLVVRHVCLQ